MQVEFENLIESVRSSRAFAATTVCNAIHLNFICFISALPPHGAGLQKKVYILPSTCRPSRREMSSLEP